MILLPAIDLMNGLCVRLTQGRFNSKKEYGDPVEQLRRIEAAGAEFAHLVDLDGARDPSRRQLATIRNLIRATRLKLQIGGGIRSIEDARELLDMGADRVVIGSMLAKKPELSHELFDKLSGRRITAAFDVRVRRGLAYVSVAGWTEEGEALESLIDRYRPLGLKRVLCTDIGRDGMLGGPNVALYGRLTHAYRDLEFQASGGVASIGDLKALENAHVHSAIVGKALYEGTLDLREALRAC